MGFWFQTAGGRSFIITVIAVSLEPTLKRDPYSGGILNEITSQKSVAIWEKIALVALICHHFRSLTWNWMLQFETGSIHWSIEWIDGASNPKLGGFLFKGRLWKDSSKHVSTWSISTPSVSNIFGLPKEIKGPSRNISGFNCCIQSKKIRQPRDVSGTKKSVIEHKRSEARGPCVACSITEFLDGLSWHQSGQKSTYIQKKSIMQFIPRSWLFPFQISTEHGFSW